MRAMGRVGTPPLLWEMLLYASTSSPYIGGYLADLTALPAPSATPAGAPLYSNLVAPGNELMVARGPAGDTASPFYSLTSPLTHLSGINLASTPANKASAFSPDGLYFAAGDVVYNRSDGSIAFTANLGVQYTQYHVCGFSPDGLYYIVGAITAVAPEDGIIRVHSTADWSVVSTWTFTGTSNSSALRDFAACVIDPSYFTVVSGVNNTFVPRYFQLPDISAGPVGTLSGTGGTNKPRAFSPNGQVLALATGGSTIQFRSGTPPFTDSGDSLTAGGTVVALTFSPNSRVLAIAYGTTIKLWDMELEAYLPDPAAAFGSVSRLMFAG